MDLISRYLPDLSLFSGGFEFNLGKLYFAPSYLQAGAIVVLLFVLVVTLSQVRRHYMDWSAKGAISGVFIGFVLALVIEGFLLISGKTVMTEILGWKNAPKPVSTALDLGRKRLETVLGTTSEFSFSPTDTQEFLDGYQSLSPADALRLRNLICQP